MSFNVIIVLYLLYLCAFDCVIICNHSYVLPAKTVASRIIFMNPHAGTTVATPCDWCAHQCTVLCGGNFGGTWANHKRLWSHMTCTFCETPAQIFYYEHKYISQNTNNVTGDYIMNCLYTIKLFIHTYYITHCRKYELMNCFAPLEVTRDNIEVEEVDDDYRHYACLGAKTETCLKRHE